MSPEMNPTQPSPELLACPFCRMKPSGDLIDTLYPGCRWREDDGIRHYLLPGDGRDGHGYTWTMHCNRSYGGCGAQISGDSRDEAIAAWNRRASLSAPQITPPKRQILIESRMGDTAQEYQVRLSIGVQSFDICQPRETMAEAEWLADQLGKALDSLSPPPEGD